MARIDPAVTAHLEWIGFVRQTGLVVSATALSNAGAILERADIQSQQILRDCIEHRPIARTGHPAGAPEPVIPDFRSFARRFLGWSFGPEGYAGTPENPIPAELERTAPGGAEILRPDYAVREFDPQNGRLPWQLLVSAFHPDTDFDAAGLGAGASEIPPRSRMERLLRETGVAAGLLFNGRTLRLISAPRGESSGWIDFHTTDMIQTAGRPIATALRMLLSEQRLLGMRRSERLAALLEESRKYQNTVSERLAEQVLHALYELLRGLQAAHDASKGGLLRETLRNHPDRIYHALLTVVLRLVFLLFAEERGLLPPDDVFLKYYSLSGLYERLREDAAMYPDTMDQRFGAWAQLLALFRMIYDGADCGNMHLPRRHGYLFDPDRFKFLEGRPESGARQNTGRIEPPLIPDGTIWRALEKLLVLDSERISYRALDVEQIGSVYETMMGFRLETAAGPSVAVRAQKRYGAPSSVDLSALLDTAPEKRDQWIQEAADRKCSDTVKKAVREARTLEDLHAALEPLIDRGASPDIVPAGAMVLQPSDERRRSGSHYTPRSLTEPIVRKALEPIFTGMGSPGPEKILELKICDPAMGSGAFLVEACRQIGDALVGAWETHAVRPVIPPDEDEVVHARRLVAQRCLYGVDRNPLAVDLAKVSLWLVTLARDHPLTFIDHALRHGDSLVGLSKKQIECFHWEAADSPFDAGFVSIGIQEPLRKVSSLRQKIRTAGDGIGDDEKRAWLNAAEFELLKTRAIGDLAVEAFFLGKTRKERERIRSDYSRNVMEGRMEVHRGRLEELRNAAQPLVPFHWELEFPEVFERDNPGFDAIAGNPPFMGGGKISSNLGDSYLEWLLKIHEKSHGNGDLVSHFFRRGFHLIRKNGTMGLIATNTIAQGDTRLTGLLWICTRGGEIYNAVKRFKWPGAAAVVVSIIHVVRGYFDGVKSINDKEVKNISAFLFHEGDHTNPKKLLANEGKSFLGSKIYGQGFTFDDTDTRGVASPIAEMNRLIEKNPANAEVIFPYIGGEEANTSPTHRHHRYVINFGERGEEECRRRWPDLMAIVEEKVKPERMKLADNPDGRRRKQNWWQFGRYTPALFAAIAGMERVLVISRVGNAFAICFINDRIVFSERLVVFPFKSYSAFCTLQSFTHEIWARFFSSTLKDDLMYAPSDCLETFPFPQNWERDSLLEAAGKTYYEFRAGLMVRNNEGLTRTYNRFHDPDETGPDILQLRNLHAAMDRAVLDSYGWTDVPADCGFFPDYEIDEEPESATPRKKKKPWRHRWPDDVRDDVLARLLSLNMERAAAERTMGAATGRGASGKTRRKDRIEEPELFG